MPFKRIYEDMVVRRLSLERFDKLSAQYQETEQKQVRQVIEEQQLPFQIRVAHAQFFKFIVNLTECHIENMEWLMQPPYYIS